MASAPQLSIEVIQWSLQRYGQGGTFKPGFVVSITVIV